MIHWIANVFQVRVPVTVLVATPDDFLYLYEVNVWGTQTNQVIDLILKPAGLQAWPVDNLPAPERKRGKRQYWVAEGRPPEGSFCVGFRDGPDFTSVHHIPHKNLHRALDCMPS